jgi:hypothetical protein
VSSVPHYGGKTNMGLYKRAHIRGMVHALTQHGVVQWPTKLAMDEAADEIADSFSDEEVPEVAEEDGLSEDTAAAALERIVEVAEDLSDKVGSFDPELQKVAASMAIEDAAGQAVVAVMEKAAEETAVQTGPDVPGATAPTPDLSATAEGEVDATNNPSSAVVVPQGTTALDTKPGAVGKEETRPDQPGAQASPPVNEAAKTAEAVQQLSSLLQTLTQQTKVAEMDGASLSGGEATGPAPEPRVDVDDNLDIDGVKAPGQGKTTMDVPAKAEVGATKAQPAGNPGPTAPTPNEPAKARKKSASALEQAVAVLQSTPQGRNMLLKISETCEAERKKEEKAEEDEKKEASVAALLTNLAHMVG